MPYPESPTVDEINNHPQLKRELFEAFNSKAKTGIERIKDICNKNGLDDTETRKQVAKFFFDNKTNLDLESVGDYIGTDTPEQNEVRQRYVDLCAPDLQGKNFAEGIRSFTDNFKLPGEGQKIGRLMNTFGAAYHQQNPNSGIADTKSAQKLATMAIMLTTDAHNPNVKNKMTLAQLTGYVKGENNGNDFDDQLIKDIYDNITSRPLTVTFEKIEPGFEMKSAQLKNDPALKALHKDLGKKQLDLGKSLGVTDLGAEVNQRKPLFGGLTGYTSKVTVTDNDGNKATLEISKPGFFSKKEPTITVKPLEGKGSLQLAAQLSTRFQTPAAIKSNYAYQREEMTQHINQQKQQSKPGLKEEPENPKVQLSRGGQRDLRQSGFEVVNESQQKPKVKANVEVKEVMKELKLSLESRKSKQEDLGDDEHNVSSKTGLTKVGESKPGESKDIGKGVHRKSGNW